MLKHICLVIMLVLLPSLAFAEDSPTPDPLATPSPTPTTASASSDGLGPQTNSNVSSMAASGALQPAGLAPLQSSVQDATNMTAPSSALQAPVTSAADLKVLAGESDGAPHSLGDDTSNSWLLAAIPIVLGLCLGGYIVWRDRRRFRGKL